MKKCVIEGAALRDSLMDHDNGAINTIREEKIPIKMRTDVY